MDNLNLEEFGKIFRNTMEEVKNESEKYWNSLSKDEQLKVFCAVSRRIFDGEISRRGSYRYVLYDVFEFGPESYAAAQDAGYLAIHNSIFTGNQIAEILKDFCENHLDITKDNLEEQINSYVVSKHY